MGRALYGMVAVFAQLRHDTIRQNTRDGVARARGQPQRWTPHRHDAGTAAQALRMRDEGMKAGAIASTLGVGRSSVLRAFERVDEEAKIGARSERYPCHHEGDEGDTMDDSDIIKQALEASEQRSQRTEAAAAAQRTRQQELRDGLVELESRTWSAHAATILYDQNHPSRVPVEWQIPRETASSFELVADGPRLEAWRTSSGNETPFIVTAPIGEDVELVLELQTPNLEPVEGFLAVHDRKVREYTQIRDLADIGDAVVAMRGQGRHQR